MSIFPPFDHSRFQRVVDDYDVAHADAAGQHTNEQVICAAAVVSARELKLIREGINAIRHFIHALPGLEVIMREQQIRHMEMRRKRLARKRANRKPRRRA